MSNYIAIPAKQFERGHDFIYVDINKNFFFEDTDGEYIQIKNIYYLNDIKSSYGEKRIDHLIEKLKGIKC